MKPSGFQYWGNPNLETYQQQTEKAIKGYISEFQDLKAKIKGSSLKEEDKKKAIRLIIAELIPNLEISL